MTLTDVACGPLGPSSVSNSTFAPSGSDLNPSPPIALKCTNTSLPPSAGVMNPNPLASLNHFTVPVAIENTSPRQLKNGQRKRTARNRHSLDSRLTLPGAPTLRCQERLVLPVAR